MQTGGSNSQSARYLQHLQVASSSQKTRIATDGSNPEGGQQQLKGANHDGSLSPGMQTEGSNSQSARYLLHLAWPGRLNIAIRSLFTSLGVAREAQIRNPLAIYSTWRGPGGSNSQSARYLQHLAWPGRLTFAIRSLFTALGVACSS